MVRERVDTCIKKKKGGEDEHAHSACGHVCNVHPNLELKTADVTLHRTGKR